MLGGVGLCAYTFGIEPHWLRVVQRDMPVENLPGDLTGRRLLQISDLHVGPKVLTGYLRKALRIVNGLKPDLLAITGDFMSYTDTWCIDEALSVVEELVPPPLGTFAVLGNHDYGRAWSQTSVADDLAGRLSNLNVRVLRNEVVETGGLQIIGIDDYWSPRFDHMRALEAADTARAAIVLCHNPDVADLPGWENYRGWILSGHTHGGQCKPPFLPPPLLPVKNRRYTRGTFDLGDGRTLYINPGLGYLRRVRFNVRPEVTVFRLVPAPGVQ